MHTAAGAELRIGTVESIETEAVAGSSGRAVTGVTVDGELIPCTKAVVAMGPWSVLAADWFDIPVPMEGVKRYLTYFISISSNSTNSDSINISITSKYHYCCCCSV
jgi:glycine/D-amino acid oxidase-like deaminating enzyme